MRLDKLSLQTPPKNVGQRPSEEKLRLKTSDPLVGWRQRQRWETKLSLDLVGPLSLTPHPGSGPLRTHSPPLHGLQQLLTAAALRHTKPLRRFYLQFHCPASASAATVGMFQSAHGQKFNLVTD